MPHLPFKTQPHSHLQRMMAGMAAGGALASSNDACCSPAPAPAPLISVLPPARRARLSELDPNVLCSIVGTCLTTAELRKLVPRHATHLDRKLASDLDIHHAAVELASDGGIVAKELHKALDTRHALTIKRFKAADGEAALRGLWSAALSNGDVPGAYWDLMTHPDATIDLRRQAFGDVHMLSHLVGASNRADIRRLAALPPLHGQCVLYVGGRPGASAVLSRMMAAAGGELLVHDGGIEDRRGLLATMLPRAQMVVFPVDCISHNAMHVTKLSCARLGIDCHPLRTASVASFVELMQRLAASAAV